MDTGTDILNLIIVWLVVLTSRPFAFGYCWMVVIVQWKTAAVVVVVGGGVGVDIGVKVGAGIGVIML